MGTDFREAARTVMTTKPEPVLFAHVCGGLGLPPNRVLMVGDSPRADVGARSFGMQAVRLARWETAAWPERIGSLGELAAIIYTTCGG